MESDVRRCPKCGNPLSGSAQFCSKCGNPVPKSAGKKVFCRICGNEMTAGDKFCRVCGTPVVEMKDEAVSNAEAARAAIPAGRGSNSDRGDSAAGRNRNPGVGSSAAGRRTNTGGTPTGRASAGGRGTYGGAYAQPRSGRAYEPSGSSLQVLCAGPFGLIITIAFTLQLLFTIFTGWFNLLISIPMILICIGCWITLVGGLQYNLRETGFSLMSGSMLAEQILACIAGALICIVGFICIAMGYSDTVVLGFFILIFGAAYIVLYWFFWRGLKKSVWDCRLVIREGEGPIGASLYSIVIIFIGAFSNLISLMSANGINSILNEFYRSLYYSMGSSDANMVISMISAAFPSPGALYWLKLIASLTAAIASAVCLIKFRSNHEVWKV